ncbi:hypothetical protein BLNAU_12259 [Blattamonas nauphoetae]|uniref:Uncharacterized protein n=1 Tax=Blattamonas nauphoetae TaxID=2049346 RepID=A0ABQ9XK37_9EUKA|nr:hypothetical protein BLNAU_12259 [Blattamonas nauphoetae]
MSTVPPLNGKKMKSGTSSPQSKRKSQTNTSPQTKRNKTVSSKSPQGQTLRSNQGTKRVSDVPLEDQPASFLTERLVTTIMTDAEASKLMSNDMTNIMELQLSPELLANYQFKNYTSMRRLLNQGSDIAPKKGKPQAGFSGEPTDTDETQVNDLEPISSKDHATRQKIRQKVMEELNPDPQIRSPSPTPSLRSQHPPPDQTLESPLGRTEANNTIVPVSNDLEGTLHNRTLKEVVQINTSGQPQAQKGYSDSDKPQIHNHSPFKEVFNDDTQLKNTTFSPFSSKAIPLTRRAKQTNEKEPDEMELSEEDDDDDDVNYPEGVADGTIVRKNKKRRNPNEIGLIERTFKQQKSKEPVQVEEVPQLSNGSVTVYKSPIRRQMENVLMGIEETEDDKEKQAGTPRTPKKRRPMVVARAFEPNNEMAVDSLPNEREIEDASLQKYTHQGIAAPPRAVAEFQRFMVETRMESHEEGSKSLKADVQKKNDLMKRKNEKGVTEKKYTRQLPASGAYVMEVKKKTESGKEEDKKED